MRRHAPAAARRVGHACAARNGRALPVRRTTTRGASAVARVVAPTPRSLRRARARAAHTDEDVIDTLTVERDLDFVALDVPVAHGREPADADAALRMAARGPIDERPAA